MQYNYTYYMVKMHSEQRNEEHFKPITGSKIFVNRTLPGMCVLNKRENLV